MSRAEADIKLEDQSSDRVKSNPDCSVALDDKTQSDEMAGPSSSESPTKSGGRGWAFWAIFGSLSVTALLSSMEGGIMSTALPAISRAVDAERDYIWVVNVYFLTSAAVQPLYGQLADIWGRRWPMLVSVIIFAAGSAVCGAANNAATLIGGRAVQGLGAAGINTLVEIILCDLLPLRERGQFMGLLFLFIVIGSVLGPFLGGIIVDRASWRWVFYLNLPICAVCLVLLFFSLKLKHRSDDDSTPLEKLKKIDVVGLLLLCASVTSLLYALTYGGGAKYSWSHPVIITTLVLGVVGHGLFIGFEASPWCPHPALPISLFQNRTSVAAYVAEAVQILVSYGALYFLPLYFQSTLLVYPSRSGILLLPFSILFCVSAAVGGAIVTKMGKFRTVHIASFALMTVMMGVFTLLNRNTHLAVLAVLGIITGISVGLPNASILTAVQAALPDSLNAASTSAFAFIRSISTVFSITIPAAIFNSRFDDLLSSSTLDSSVKASLSLGQAYQQASRDFVRSFPEAVQDQIIGMYEMSLQRVWQVLIALAGVGVIASLIEKDLECRTEQTTEDFGLKEDQPNQNPDKGEV
ncbi:major facilitator superfamily protein [Colletotrichum tofieldiae]|uniref:Major facilitator superfamily protein n=1 Tax=Colletotrichum tofieldiae TaxID=708197 RepID=A0A166WE51_9PEZI|nr:major facilitator superfamily protein [Colletotrichum tofieldiae]